jgi:hypothetical protein
MPHTKFDNFCCRASRRITDSALHRFVRREPPVMPWDQSVRRAAVRFYEQAGHCQKEAGALLKAHLEGVAPAKPGKFCKDWWQRWRDNRSVESLPKPGRPPKVPRSLAAKIATEIEKNARSNTESAYFCSISDVVDQNPALKEEMGQLGAHPKTIERAVLKASPNLTKRKVKVQVQLSDQQKESRRKFAAAMKRCPQYKRNAMVFIDESSFDLKHESKSIVFAARGKSLPPRTSPHACKKARFHVHYLGAVMHGVGSVAFIPLTGTTGKPKLYKVGTASSTLLITLTSGRLPKDGDQVTLPKSRVTSALMNSLHPLITSTSCSIRYLQDGRSNS